MATPASAAIDAIVVAAYPLARNRFLAMNGSTDPLAMVQRLLDATNAHDIDGIVSCFSDDYVNEIPVHPARGFHGTEQIRRNWTQLFDGIPDLKASVLARAANGETAWTEWEISGARRDGAVHIMRGVIIFGVRRGKAAWAKFSTWNRLNNPPAMSTLPSHEPAAPYRRVVHRHDPPCRRYRHPWHEAADAPPRR